LQQILLYQDLGGSGSDPEVEMRTLSKLHATQHDPKQDAISWLRSQLRWERMLGELRSNERGGVAKQAA
jgi:hypothetical protein